MKKKSLQIIKKIFLEFNSEKSLSAVSRSNSTMVVTVTFFFYSWKPIITANGDIHLKTTTADEEFTVFLYKRQVQHNCTSDSWTTP